MNEVEFVEQMNKHNLTLTELQVLYWQYRNFNYMTRTDVEEELSKREVETNESIK